MSLTFISAYALTQISVLVRSSLPALMTRAHSHVRDPPMRVRFMSLSSMERPSSELYELALGFGLVKKLTTILTLLFLRI